MIFDLFLTLREVSDAYTAGFLIILLLGLAGVFLYNFKFRLLPAGAYIGTTADIIYLREEYSVWRGRLDHGGTLGFEYERLVRRFLGWIGKVYGHAEPGRERLSGFWSKETLDRCLMLALIYPAISVLLVWHMTGEVGAFERALEFREDIEPALRGASAIAMALLVAAQIWLAAPPVRFQTPLWRAVRVAIVGLIVVAAIILSTRGVALSPDTDFQAVAGTGAMAGCAVFGGFFAMVLLRGRYGVGVTAIVVVGIACIAFAFIGTGVLGYQSDLRGDSAISVATPTGLLVALLIVVGSRLINRRPWPRWLLVLFVFKLLVLYPLIIAYLPHIVGVQENANWTLLLLLGVFPLINALFDWVSLGTTRGLLRLGLRLRGLWPIALALLDLVCAILLLGLLISTLVAYISGLNIANTLSGWPAIFEPGILIETIRTDPANPSAWWVYLMILTALLPSISNLVIGGLSVIRGLPFIGLMVAGILPKDPIELTINRRFWGSIFLTLQFATAVILAVILSISVFYLVTYGLGKIGWGLLQTAELFAHSVQLSN